ncbi:MULTISPECIES: hypothetical protein, partial [unclassified Limnospira]|uniref:hypothetical protein n=1 Tax=unclassified Limnospira TaxID=2642885 RepID=UPI0028E0E3FC
YRFPLPSPRRSLSPSLSKASQKLSHAFPKLSHGFPQTLKGDRNHLHFPTLPDTYIGFPE